MENPKISFVFSVTWKTQQSHWCAVLHGKPNNLTGAQCYMENPKISLVRSVTRKTEKKKAKKNFSIYTRIITAYSK